MLLAGQSSQRQRKLQQLRKEVSETEEKYQDLLQENGRCRHRACHGHRYYYSTFNSVGYNTHEVSHTLHYASGTACRLQKEFAAEVEVHTAEMQRLTEPLFGQSITAVRTISLIPRLSRTVLNDL